MSGDGTFGPDALSERPRGDSPSANLLILDPQFDLVASLFVMIIALYYKLENSETLARSKKIWNLNTGSANQCPPAAADKIF